MRDSVRKHKPNSKVVYESNKVDLWIVMAVLVGVVMFLITALGIFGIIS